MEHLLELIVGFYNDTIVPFYNDVVVTAVPFLAQFEAWMALCAVAVVVLLIITIIVAIAAKGKKKKIIFFVDGARYAVTKSKRKNDIAFPDAPEKEGCKFEGWYKDKKCKRKYVKTALDKKADMKTLKLYAKFVGANGEAVNTAPAKPEKPAKVKKVKETAPIAPAVETAPAKETASTIDLPTAENNEEKIDVEMSIGDFYDELRFNILGYERASQFKKLGVKRKQIVAEMFERDGVIYLYLAVDPAVMQAKGHAVEKYSEPEFAIVPCKKVVANKQDFEEALALIKDAMHVNNLVKSSFNFAQKVTSDEQARKLGFASFVKNENAATTADDYYRLLRAVVLSYHAKADTTINDADNNKMVVKVIKKGEEISLYLALDPEKEGLKNVSFDANYADTPAQFVVKAADDCSKANELIEKVMMAYGLEKSPEKAQIVLDDQIERNCGFGYRIKK